MAALSPGWVGLLAAFGIVLGALVAALLAQRRLSLAGLAIPVRSLLVTARPLLLPLVAAVIVGLFNSGGWLVVAGAALLTFIAARLLVLSEALALRDAGRFDLRLLRRHGPWLALLAAALTAILYGGSSNRSLESIGGFASVLLILALVLWVLAAGLRLFSYCSSWLRAAVALFVVLTGYRLAAAVGLVPGGDLISDHLAFLDWSLPALALAFIVLVGALDVVAERLGEDPDGERLTERLPAFLRAIRSRALHPGGVRLFQGLGLIAALFAAIVLVGAAWTGLTETDQPGAKLQTATAVSGEEAAPPPAPSSFATDEALAQAYSPVLALTRNERWSPIPYDDYAREAVLSGPMTKPLPVQPSTAEKLDVGCPRLSSAPCFRLSIRCQTGAEACADPEPHPDRSDQDIYREGDVYVRVERRAAEEAVESQRRTEHLPPSDRWPPQVFRPEGPYARKLTILLQYWYFYRYDEWETHAFAGELVQRHEGDWEGVTIGLSDSEPLFVAYSAHCAGTWVPWEEAKISDKLGGRTHPLVAVAEGSHANYPSADQKRSPDWAGCQGAPAGTTTLLSYASNIRDKTEYGWEWYPAEGGIVEVGEDQPPMSFPGYWGASEETVLYGFFKSTQLGEGSGPQTPSEQPLWRTPVTKIFCDNYSQPQLPASLSNYHCRKKE